MYNYICATCDKYEDNCICNAFERDIKRKRVKKKKKKTRDDIELEILMLVQNYGDIIHEIDKARLDSNLRKQKSEAKKSGKLLEKIVCPICEKEIPKEKKERGLNEERILLL